MFKSERAKLMNKRGRDKRKRKKQKIDEHMQEMRDYQHEPTDISMELSAIIHSCDHQKSESTVNPSPINPSPIRTTQYIAPQYVPQQTIHHPEKLSKRARLLYRNTQQQLLNNNK